MQEGTVKFFNESKGFGFITMDQDQKLGRKIKKDKFELC